MKNYRQKKTESVRVRLTISEHNNLMREAIENDTTISDVIRIKLFEADCLHLLYKGYYVSIDPMGRGTDELCVYVVQSRFVNILSLFDFACEESIEPKLRAAGFKTFENEDGEILTKGNHVLDGKPLGFLLYSHEEETLEWIISQEDTDNRTAWLSYAMNQINEWIDE
jgi:hypothetical protein